MARIAIGCVQFGLNYGVSNTTGKPGVTEIKEIVELATEHGVSVYDTAPAYGESEIALGETLHGNEKIVTKTPIFKETKISNIHVRKLRSVFLESLCKLKRSKLYGLLIHNADDLNKPGSDALYTEMLRLKEEEKIKKIGVSIYSSIHLDNVLKNYDIDLVQLPVNIFDQRLIQSGHLSRLKNLEIEVHSRSTFLQGLLIMKPEERPMYFLNYQKQLNKYFARIQNLGMTSLKAALGFVQALPQVDQIIVGVNSTSQLKEIFQASGAQVNPENFLDIAIADTSLIDPSLWKL